MNIKDWISTSKVKFVEKIILNKNIQNQKLFLVDTF